MAGLKIIEDRAVSLSELKEELKDIKKRDEELGFRTAKVADYLDNIKVLKQKESEEIFAKIQKLNIPRIKDSQIIKIIDVMPSNMMEFKNIMQAYATTVTNENLEKILELLADYLPKKK